MVTFIVSVALGFIITFFAVGLFIGLGRVFQFWRILPERTVIVYTNFGKVIGEVSEPGMFFPVFHFGPKAILLPLFGRAYTVTTALQQSYLRNQLVNSEEGAPMGVGVWYEMYVQNCTAYLFQNSDPVGSLRANRGDGRIPPALESEARDASSRTGTPFPPRCARRCPRPRSSGASSSDRPTYERSPSGIAA